MSETGLSPSNPPLETLTEPVNENLGETTLPQFVEAPQSENIAEQVEAANRKANLTERLKDPTLTDKQQINATEGFLSYGGTLDELKSDPSLTGVAERYEQFKGSQLESQKMFFDSLNQEAQRLEGQPLSQEWQQQISAYMNSYENSFDDFSGNLLTEEGIKIIGEKNPAVEQWLRQEIENRFNDLSLRANDRALSYIGKIMNLPEAPENLKQTARESAILVLKDSTHLLTSGSETVPEQIMNQAAQLGIDSGELLQQTSENVEAIAEEASNDEEAKKINIVDLLGLKDEQGNLRKGKVLGIGAVIALFVIADQVIAKASGQRALIPFLMEAAFSVGGKIEHHERLEKIKVQNPDAYNNYYALMGHDESFLTNWLIKQAKEKIISN